MNLKNYLMFTVIVFIFSCGSPKLTPATMPFDALLGKWIMKTKERTAVENWKRKDSVYLGISSIGKDGAKPTPFETVTINHNGKGFFYTVTGLNDKTVVAFEITKYSRTGFVAENKMHDYPKRISYDFISKDSIVAFIDDGENNEKNRVYFYYKKSKK